MEKQTTNANADMEYKSFSNFLDAVLHDYQNNHNKKQSKKIALQTPQKKIIPTIAKPKKEEKENQALLQEKYELQQKITALEKQKALGKQEQERLTKIAEQTAYELIKEKQEIAALKEKWNIIEAQQKEQDAGLPLIPGKKNIPITEKEKQLGMNILINSYKDFDVHNKKNLARHLFIVAGNLFMNPQLNDKKSGPFFIEDAHLLWSMINQSFFYLYSPCTKKFMIEKYISYKATISDEDIDCSGIMCDRPNCTVFREVRVKTCKIPSL